MDYEIKCDCIIESVKICLIIEGVDVQFFVFFCIEEGVGDDQEYRGSFLELFGDFNVCDLNLRNERDEEIVNFGLYGGVGLFG